MESLVNYIDLFMVLRDHVGSLSDSKGLFEYFKEIQNRNWTEESSSSLLLFCQNFCSKVSGKWQRSNRTLGNFMKKNDDWLESAIVWPSHITCVAQSEHFQCSKDDISEDFQNQLPKTSSPEPSTSKPLTPEPSTSHFTPRKPFEELSNKQKRRRVEELNISFSPDELKAASLKSLQSSGNVELKNIMEHLYSHPEDIDKVKTCLRKNKENSVYTPEEALALLIFNNLSKCQYLNLRDSAEEKGSSIYPSYYKLQQEKRNCYPPQEDVTITEDGATINLQALLDLTTSRLLEALKFHISSKSELKLISKWGFDGASSQSTYKQKATNPGFDDSSVFMASLVPIRLMCAEEIVWENDRPSSTDYCRPILFKFLKENIDTIQYYKQLIEMQIHALQSSTHQEVNVKHELLMTMIDGKVSSCISDTATTVCDICHAKPTEMNNLDEILRRHKNQDMYQYGLSSLHAWIRCMECLLHIAYRMDFKKWSSRGEDKEKMAERKLHIQKAFREETGLLIDVVKQGAGTSNDGNTVRRFFSDYKLSARITGIDENLIEKFYVILQTIASGEHINVSKFSEFCMETATLYVQLYPWYYMPSSVHKLLIHGADIIEHFGLVPIGKLSEEASEARNKDFRKFREHHSRKVSRTATNEDILHNFLLSSDPKLTFVRPRMAKQRKTKLLPQAVALLRPHPNESELEFIDVDKLHDSDSD